MTDRLTELIAALREELQNYGELLGLLDRQQEYVFARDAEELFQSAGAVQAQAATLQQARARRDDLRSRVAERLGLAADAPLGAVIPLLPADYRPLVQALVHENNELLTRLQHRARQNHLLLSRSVDLMQQFLSTLLPVHDPQVYTDAGQSRRGGISPSAVFDAVG